MISVDFPAPFSPIKATTSEAAIFSETESSALTPGNDFEMPASARTFDTAGIVIYFFGASAGFAAGEAASAVPRLISSAEYFFVF